MQKWEIDFEIIANGNPDIKRILSKRGADGWEPYAISGIYHYFKRPLSNVVVAASGKGDLAMISGNMGKNVIKSKTKGKK